MLWLRLTEAVWRDNLRVKRVHLARRAPPVPAAGPGTAPLRPSVAARLAPLPSHL